MRFLEALASGPPILAEGSVVERLRRDPEVRLDPSIAHAGFIYEPRAAAALERLYRGYLEIGRAARLPMLCLTPTWRANPERLRLAGLHERDVNGDAVRFLERIRADYGRAVYLGGLTGCYGDAYRPEEALTAGDAARFHRPQAQALASAGVDFLLASTLPAADEALGIARAMSPLGVPYLLSFIITGDGTLLDGTPLARSHRANRPRRLTRSRGLPGQLRPCFRLRARGAAGPRSGVTGQHLAQEPARARRAGAPGGGGAAAVSPRAWRNSCGGSACASWADAAAPTTVTSRRWRTCFPGAYVVAEAHFDGNIGVQRGVHRAAAHGPLHHFAFLGAEVLRQMQRHGQRRQRVPGLVHPPGYLHGGSGHLKPDALAHHGGHR